MFNEEFLRKIKNIYEYRGPKHQREDNGDGFDVYCFRAVTVTVHVLNCRLIAKSLTDIPPGGSMSN